MFFFLSIASANEVRPQWSLTINPTQIEYDFLEFQQERNLTDTFSFGIIEGLGQQDTHWKMSLGGFSRYYLMGDFQGGLGISSKFVYTKLVYQQDERITKGNLLVPSLTINTKYIFDMGLTIDPYLGLEWTTLFLEATDLPSITESDVGWVFGLNIGWTLAFENFYLGAIISQYKHSQAPN